MSTIGSETRASADPTVSRFFDSLQCRDFEALAACLTQDVWFRALLPKSLVELSSRPEVDRRYRDWFGGAVEFQLLESAQHRLGNRYFLRYRLRLRDAETNGLVAVEQCGYCRLQDGLIRRLDLVCTGLHPTE